MLFKGRSWDRWDYQISTNTKQLQRRQIWKWREFCSSNMSDNFDNLSKSDLGFPEPGGGGSMSSRTDLSQAAQTCSSLRTESMDFVLKYIRRLDELRPGIWSRISLDDCLAIISTFVELTGNAFPIIWMNHFYVKKSRKYLGTSTTNQIWRQIIYFCLGGSIHETYRLMCSTGPFLGLLGPIRHKKCHKTLNFCFWGFSKFQWMIFDFSSL